jgi:hypothetical protein
MEKELLQSWEALPHILATSSTSKAGRDELLDYIHSIVKINKTNPN